MKVLGQLESAQLEQITPLPGGTPPTGRVVADVTNPLAAVPYFFNGTAWRPLALSQTLATVTTNSGKAVTVDWSLGLNQKIVLTDNAVISFSNPVEGAVHTLIVQQVATGVQPFIYKLNMPDQDISRGMNQTSGYGGFMFQPPRALPIRGLQYFGWFYQAGIKAAYATIPLATTSPSGGYIPPTAVTGVNYYSNGTAFYAGRTSTPFWMRQIIMDTVSSNQFQVSMFYQAPSTALAATGQMRQSPNGAFWAMASGTSPFIQAGVDGQAGNGTLSAWANPATLPTGSGASCDWHPSGLFLAVAHSTTPFMSIYPMNSTAFGAKLADPVSLPPGNGQQVAFAPTGDFIAHAAGTTPFISVWPFTINSAGTATIGAKVANPSVLPAGNPASTVGSCSLAWRPQGDYIAMSMGVTPFLYVVPFNRATSSFGVPLTISGVNLPPGIVNSVRWSPDGLYLICGCTTTPFLLIYDFVNFTLGAPVSYDLPAPPIGAINDVDIHPNGEIVMVGTQATPFFFQVNMPNHVRNYMRIF